MYMTEDFKINIEYTNAHDFLIDGIDRFTAASLSQEFYKELDTMHRAAIVERVKRGLMLAYDRVEDWLPESFVFDDVGTLVGVEVKLCVTDIERDVNDMSVITSDITKSFLGEAKEFLSSGVVDEARDS